jgi:hypothetical protein
MSLAALQKAVAKAIMQPLTRSEHMSPVGPGGGKMRSYAARYIKPNNRLTSFERLEIYNRQYWFRVLAGLAEDFPGLRAVLGSQRLEAMCKVYLTDCPSTSFTLRNLGARLESWLRKNPVWIRSRRELALDMVRIEWADIEAFDGEAKPTLRPEDLSGIGGPRVRLSLQPYVQLLELSYPVDDLLLAVKHGNDADDFASNAMQERKKRNKVRAVAKLKPAQIFLVVHRVDYSVYFRRIQREEFVLLSALRSGKSMEQAIGTAFKNSSIPTPQRAEFVQRAFQTWATLGWFCRPEATARVRTRGEKRA